jgi:hypothetical protein
VVREGESRSTLEVDVTDLVRTIAEGEAPNNGFLILPEDSDRTGFDATEDLFLGSLAGGELRVTYRSLKALGMRGGRQAITAVRSERKGGR